MSKDNLKKFKPLSNTSIIDKVEENLLDYLIEEDLKPTDSLPNEVELAEAMQVSRTAIREALARLKTLGLIESRRNRGMVITQPDVLENFKRVLNPRFLDSETLMDIFEFRLVLEMGIADFLFKRKNEQNLKELEKIVEREEATDDSLEQTKLDIEFHRKLYEISDNDTIERFQKILLPIFDYVNNGTIPAVSNVADRATHRDLLECLKNGTPEEFRKKMKTHLDPYFQKIERK